MDQNYIEKYRQIETPKCVLHLYLRLRHIRSSVEVGVNNDGFRSTTSLDFSGIAQIYGYKPLIGTYRASDVALSSPAIVLVNDLGFDEDCFRQGRIGVGRFESDRIFIDISLPEMAISRLLEIMKNYRCESTQEFETQRFRAEEFPEFKPDYCLRAHFEIIPASNNRKDVLPFNVTYIATDLVKPIFI